MKNLNSNTNDQFFPDIDPKELELGDYLGKGASGFVHKATYKKNGAQLALKVTLSLFRLNTQII